MAATIALGLSALGSGCREMPRATTMRLAEGVYAREAAATFPRRAPNQGFVLFRDFVLVVDPGSIPRAQELQREILAITPLPIRIVFVTHAHGDHLDGAGVFADEGAEIVAAEAGRAEFEGAARQRFDQARKKGFKGYERGRYASPARYFDGRLVLDDETQRVELLEWGRGHAPGDAVAYVPGAGVLFSGDLCDNGAFNSFAQADTSSWSAILDRLMALDARKVVPGHGRVGGPEMLATQHRYVSELRQEVARGLREGRNQQAIAAGLRMPFYEAWTGVAAKTRLGDVEQVARELGAPPPPPRRRISSRGTTLAGLAVGVAALSILFVARRRAGRAR